MDELLVSRSAHTGVLWKALSLMLGSILVVGMLWGQSAVSAEKVGAPFSPADPIELTEGFEAGLVPPTNWTLDQSNPSETWKLNTNPHSGAYSAHVVYDPHLVQQDEVLLSPAMDLGSATLRFWSFGSLYWCRDTFDNCDLEVWIVVGDWDGGSGDDVYVATADDDWSGTWVWSRTTLDLTPYLPGGSVRIAFRYTGLDGAEVALDDIYLSGDSPVPTETGTPTVTNTPTPTTVAGTPPSLAWLPLVRRDPSPTPTNTPTPTKTPTPTATPIVVTGDYVGTTDQGKIVAFDVNSDLTAVTRFRIQMSCPGVSVDNTYSGSWPIANREFNFQVSAGMSYKDKFTGKFDSSFSSASGTWLVHVISYVPYPHLVCSANGTWNASRQ